MLDMTRVRSKGAVTKEVLCPIMLKTIYDSSVVQCGMRGYFC